MRILIFEPDFGGHRYTYIRHLITGLKPLSGIDSITLVISKAGHASDEYETQLKPIEDGINVMPELEVPTGSQLEVAKQRFNALDEAIKRHDADHLYVPSADGLTQVLGARSLLPGGKIIPKHMTTEAAMHRGSFAYPAGDLQRKAKIALGFKTIERSPWTRIHFVDPLGYEAAKVMSKKLATRSVVLADPVDAVQEINKKQARKNLGIEQTGRWIGVSGAIDARKGCDKLLAAFDMAKLGDSDRLLLAGKAHDDIRALVKDKYQHHVDSGRLVMIDRYISDDELAWSLSAMDVVCTAHPSHVGLSNIALRALAANRLVLGSSFGWLGRVVPAFEMGVVCNVSSAKEFAGAIEQALDGAQWYKRTAAGKRLLEFHSQENHIAGWTTLIREKLGLPAPDVKTWEWATEGVNS
jgi:glycosyltransferase involved in cell wall biosynthesis